jgi:hypothetical protein
MMLFIKGESIILKAVLTSNRKITKSNLVWVSNIDGKLGSGSLLELTNLSVGNHNNSLRVWYKNRYSNHYFHDLWALYQSHLSQHEISSIMGDFAMNVLDDSVSG